jgi:preprotein translocase subunit SecF
MKENLSGREYTIERLESVGPKVGTDLRASALEALFYATLLISVYVSGRFEQRWTIAILMAVALGGGIYALGNIFGINKGVLVLAAGILTVVICWKLRLAFALGAVVSIVHDLMITVGIFSILNKEFDLTIIAALLTVVGYSLNDTIIVFDRIRENLRGSKKTTLGGIINKSINQTLSRTVLTSGTTLLVVISLLFLGGDIIHDFALVLLIGVVVGTYSSIFVASPVLLYFEDNIFMQVAKEKEEKEKEEVRKRNKGLPQV